MTAITLPRGLGIFCPRSSVLDDAALGTTIATLRACGAAIAPVMVEGLPIRGGRGQFITPRVQPARYRAIASRMRAEGIEPIACTFPAIDGDLRDARQHLAACRVEGESLGMLDAEPRRRGGDPKAELVHWSPSLIQPWRDDDPHLLITSTRAELPQIGWLGAVETWLQLEAQTSTLTIEQAITTATRTTARNLIVPVGGVFDDKEHNDPRTPDEIRVDLARSTPQARASGRMGEWSIVSVTLTKAAVLREWVESRPFG